MQKTKLVPEMLHVKDLGKVRNVFVYGTLKKGHGLHTMLGNSKKVADASIRGYMFSLGKFPAVVLEESGTWIRGEVYNCTPDVIEAMDYTEGCPDFYRRVCVELSSSELVWVYVIPREDRDKAWKVVPGGWWTDNVYTSDVGLEAFITQQNHGRGQGMATMYLPTTPWLYYNEDNQVPVVVQDWGKWNQRRNPPTILQPHYPTGPWIKGLTITWMDEHKQELSRADAKPEVYGV